MINPLKTEMIKQKVSIIVPTLHGGKDLNDLLSSIEKCNYPKSKLETVIIDNANGNATKDAKQKYPWIKAINSKDNLGFARAVNLGIKKANGNYIFIANDDTVLSPDSIKQMVTKFQKDKTIGILSGKIFFKDKPKTIASHGHDFSFLLGLVKDDPRSPDIEKEPLWVDGCAMMIPKTTIQKLNELGDKFEQTTWTRLKAWPAHQLTNLNISNPLSSNKFPSSNANQLKLFDEKFSPMYFEDADLCIGVKKAGLRVVYDPTIIFYHGQSRSYSQLSTINKYYCWYKSKLRFMLKHTNSLLLPISLLFQLPTSIYLTLLRKAR